MAVEAGPSKSGGEEPAHKKLWPNMGGKAPPKGILAGRQGKEVQEVLAWDSCPPWDMAVPKEHRAPDLETPLLAASPWDSHASRQIWHALPGMCYYMPAGSCRGIYSRPHGRCKPLCHPCKTGHNYAQGHSVTLPHLGRPSTLLKSSPEICFRISVGCKLCGFFWLVQGLES